MFGDKFTNYARGHTPELYRMDVSISGHKLALSDFDRVNALIVHNNILNGHQEKVAIFCPTGSLTEIYMLIMAGLAFYKDAADRNDQLSEKDFSPGMLVYYKGELLEYTGIEFDKSDNENRYVLVNDDPKNKTRTLLRASQFGSVSKYSGSRTTADKPQKKTRVPVIEKTIRELIGYEGQQAKLSDYRSLLICPATPSLIDILKETTINGQPFFNIFPSAKYTPSGIQRIGRDDQKRSYVFYFASTLSTAHDLLQLQPNAGIKAVFADAEKVNRSASLVASMQSDYSVEDVYILGSAAYPELTSKLEGLGFSIWVWQHADFVSLCEHGYVAMRGNIPDRRPVYVRNHNNLVSSMAESAVTVKEVAYPAGFTKSDHASLLRGLAKIGKLTRGQQNSVAEEFLRSAYGLVNKLFQVPCPITTPGDGKLDAYMSGLSMKASLLAGQLSTSAEDIRKIMELATKAKSSFEQDCGKYEALMGIIKGNSTGTCILVRRAQYIEALNRDLVSGITSHNFEIATDPARVDPECTRLAWTFRPTLRQYADSSAIPTDSSFLLYPQQVEELRALRSRYGSLVARYARADARAATLKIDLGFLGNDPPVEIATTDNEATDSIEMEEMLFSPDLLRRSGGSPTRDRGGIIKTRLVTFVGGFIAYFEPGQSVRTIGMDDEGVSTIEYKTLETLETGDQVVFIKEERNTIFDELVDYFGHKPEILKMVKLAEAWRNALQEYCQKNNLDVQALRRALAEAGLDRTEVSIRSWLKGKTICPLEDNYRPVDVIAELTGDEFLRAEKESVKDAGRQLHSLHIKIGHYLARRILQSAVVEEKFNDPLLERKLNTASSYSEVAEVLEVGNEVDIEASLASRLLGGEDF